MSFQVRIHKMRDFTEGMQNVMRSVQPPSLADALAEGAMVVLYGVQDNILERELHVTGELYDSVKVRKVNQYAVDVRVEAEYGAVHEFGYTGQVTDKQRAFFWAKWSETGDEMWKALALSESYTIPAQPYVRPAIDENERDTKLAVKRALARYLRERLRS